MGVASVEYSARPRAPSLYGGTRAEYAIVILALIAPWSVHVRNAEELRQELVVRNVDYILWQHRSDFAPTLPVLRRQLQGAEWVEYRVIHQNTINLLLALAKNPFETVYADGRTVLISLRPPSQAPPPSQEDRPHSTVDRAMTPSTSPLDSSGR